MQCEEVPELSLGDDAVRIFLNTHGTNTGGVSKELIELLKYMEHTTEEVSRTCASERIHNIQKRIQAIKSSEKIGVKYMQAWEEKIMEQNKAREEGHAAGILEAVSYTHLDIAAVKASRTDKSACFLGPNVIELCRMADITFLGLHGGCLLYTSGTVLSASTVVSSSSNFSFPISISIITCNPIFLEFTTDTVNSSRIFSI